MWWDFPQMRVSVSTIWDLARRVGEIMEKPARVENAEGRPLEQGRESGASSTQLAKITVTTQPAPTPGGVYTADGVDLIVTLGVSGGSVSFGGPTTDISLYAEETQQLVNWLVGECRYRWGRGPFVIAAAGIVAVAIAASTAGALILALRADHGWVLVPLILAGVFVVASALARRAWMFVRRQIADSRGQLIDPRPREQVALARENSKAATKDKIIGAVITLLTGAVVALAAQFWHLLRS
jgi:hypothetical protein